MSCSVRAPYYERNRPGRQATIEGVIVDPTLPSGFYDTSHAARNPQEVADWWFRPYIVTAPTDAGWYRVDVLDGDEPDRPTQRGSFLMLAEAIDSVLALRAYRSRISPPVSRDFTSEAIDSSCPSCGGGAVDRFVFREWIVYLCDDCDHTECESRYSFT